MLTESQIDNCVATLEFAFRSGIQQPPLSQTFPNMTVADAYRIQRLFVNRRRAEGQNIRGYKIGLTSKPMQELAGVDEPDYGALLDSQILQEGSLVPTSRFIRPAIEIEIAFILKASLSGPGVTAEEVVAAVDYVQAAIEVVDFRLQIKGRRKGIFDTVADLASCGALVRGENRVRLDALNLSSVTGRLLRNGNLVEEGSADLVLGHPVNAVTWLVNKLHEIDGTSFEPGQIILSGSFIKLCTARPGDEFEAQMSDGLGNVSIRFSP